MNENGDLGVIKINVAAMIRHRIDLSIDKVERMYADDMYWYQMKDPRTVNKRRLAIANLAKFQKWIHMMNDDELVKLVHVKGFMTTLSNYVSIMEYIITGQCEHLLWRARYVLSVMLLISNVTRVDWIGDKSIGVVARGMLRERKFIRPNDYFNNIGTSNIHRRNIQELHDRITLI